MDQLKEMIERDISEKEHIKSLLSKVSAVQVITIVIGFFLVAVIGLDIYLNTQLLSEIRTNRGIGSVILKKLDVIEKK